MRQHYTMNSINTCRKVSFVSVIIACLFVSSFSQIQWTPLNSSPTHLNLNDIVTAGEEIVAVGDAGTIIVSNDSGPPGGIFLPIQHQICIR